jgi:DtxR family transcriptional regulator, Mn-dependent transcriptional regulator
MKLSDKSEEILEALWVAVEEENQPALDPVKSGFSLDDPAYGELVSNSLVEIKGGQVYFLPAGRDEGRMTIRRHRLAEKLMTDVLNLRGDNWDNKACEFEHLLHEGVDVKICTMLNHPTTCPHGKPIPPGECCAAARDSGDLGVVPLTEFKPGQDGEIAYIQTEDDRKMQKLMAMGVLPGNKIALVQSYPSYIFRIGYSEFAIDTNLAREIFVRK